MLLAAYIGDLPTFECLWSFAKSELDNFGFMNWQISSDGNVLGSGGATDADQVSNSCTL